MIYNENEKLEICKQRVHASIGKIEAQRKKPKYRCMTVGCNEFAIGSHSQQMGGQLKVIAEDNKVVCLKRSLYDLYQDDFDGHPKLEPTHISKASVFPGYCNHHDTKVFECIEKEPLEINNSKQASTLFLRSISHEVAQKRTFFDANKKILKMCSSYLNRRYVDLVEKMQLGRDKFLSNDAPYYLDKALLSVREPTVISTVWIKLDEILPASICTVFSPIRDPDEKLVVLITANNV